jgi:pimeloyl-ACP methyl ester carboxylesterase
LTEKPAPPHPATGGWLIDTDVVQANIKDEGIGPPIVMIHGFSAALGWWDAIAPELAKDHRAPALGAWIGPTHRG